MHDQPKPQCGNCKWWDRYVTGHIGDCLFEVDRSLWPLAWSTTRTTNRYATCQFHEPKPVTAVRVQFTRELMNKCLMQFRDGDDCARLFDLAATIGDRRVTVEIKIMEENEDGEM